MSVGSAKKCPRVPRVPSSVREFQKRLRVPRVSESSIRTWKIFGRFQIHNITLFDEAAAKTAEPILTLDMSIDAVWRESDPFLKIKNIGQ